MLWLVLPSACRDHLRKHDEGDCGCSCRRLGWEVIKLQRVQTCKDLVTSYTSSSIIGRAAYLLQCLAVRARNRTLMLLCGADRNVQSECVGLGFETSWREGVGLSPVASDYP